MEQSYSIFIEDDTRRDIRNILGYYEFNLQLPSIGLKIVFAIHQKIKELTITPEGSPIYEQSRIDREIRVMHERKYKYNIYYVIDKERRRVHIIRIFHARQRQLN